MSTHTPGPWGWFGDPKHGGFYLATKHSGRRYVMGFERMGFHHAQPTFQISGEGMIEGRELCRFAVAPNVVGVSAAKGPNSGVYRYDITEFDHPDARLIAAAPELLEALINLERTSGIGFMLNDPERVAARDAIAKATGAE